eukprot:scaffold907_cov120-Isochrysis_galbana.AAC.4
MHDYPRRRGTRCGRSHSLAVQPQPYMNDCPPPQSTRRARRCDHRGGRARQRPRARPLSFGPIRPGHRTRWQSQGQLHHSQHPEPHARLAPYRSSQKARPRLRLLVAGCLWARERRHRPNCHGLRRRSAV